MKPRQVEIFVKLTSLRTLVTMSAIGDPKEMVESLTRDGYMARKVGSDIIVIEEKS